MMFVIRCVVKTIKDLALLYKDFEEITAEIQMVKE
jgi:hypothetical protein